MTVNTDAEKLAAQLECWSGTVFPEPIGGGYTNTNFVVRDRGKRYFVRIGDDLPVHSILRFNETAISRAAAAAGVSPEVFHSQKGALVIRFIDGHTLTPDDVRSSEMLERIVPLVRKTHEEVPKHLRGPILMFWAFHVIRDYVSALADAGGEGRESLSGLLTKAEILEDAVGQIDVVLGHNDLMAANFIDDGDRLWLIDWDYAGFNSPLFDLGGLASNNQLSPDQETWLLETYFGSKLASGVRRQFHAMKCASLLRETLWCMTSAIHSTVDVDFDAHAKDNLARFELEYEAFVRPKRT